jgi:Bacterial Ig-like domain
MIGHSLKLAFRAIMLCSSLLVLNSCPNPTPTPSPNGVIAQTPKAGAINVPLETNLSFQFAQAMNTASVEAAITFEPLLVCDWAWSNDKTVATCDPRFDLQAGTQYKTTLSGSATNQKSEAINKFESVFTTIETREFIGFLTDPRILRGAWSGTLNDYPSVGQQTTLKLNLTARYLDETRYETRGSLEVDSLNLSSFGGFALGLNADRYLKSLNNAPYAILTGTNADRSGTWFLTCERLRRSEAVYTCEFRPSGLDGYMLELRRQ